MKAQLDHLALSLDILYAVETRDIQPYYHL